MGTYMKKKIQYLIVDTSAFINQAPLQEIGENVITVPEVINEIKSKRQLRRLVALPYDLQIKEVHSESVKFGEKKSIFWATKSSFKELSFVAESRYVFNQLKIFSVNEFSKKTGDYVSLSATDINVIALTYQIEKENNGTEHLNKAPLNKASIEPFNNIPEDLRNVVGFHLPKKQNHGSKTGAKINSNHQDEQSVYDSAEDEEFDDAKEELDSDNSLENLEVEISKLSCENLNEIDKKLDNRIKNTISKNDADEENCQKLTDLLSEDKETDYVGDDDDDYADGEDDDEDDDDDSDWITPNNVGLVKSKIANEVIEEFENIKVACITRDFAVQNVLKQIGLHVVSLDGKLIKQLRTFILRCYGCFKTTSIMTKVFCPNCGNKTLKKVGVSLNADGTQHLHINFRKPLTARGKRYSLPLPKGGKHSNNPILCEDQPLPQQKPSRLSRTKNNPLNDDYIAGYSPFVMRDVTSKSAMLGIKPHIEMKHWMRRNPNESKKKRK